MNHSADDASAKVKKPFGFWSTTFLVVANMIGAGVFTTSGFSLADLGDREFVILTWLIGGLVALCGAYSYGQLAQRIAESGGEYLYLSRMVHPLVGFVAGWVSLLAGFTGAIAFAATVFESYALPESIKPAWMQPGMLGITVILIFGALHSLILKVGLRTQNLIVILKIGLLLGFVLYAFAYFPGSWPGMQLATEPTEFSISKMAATLVWISLSFSGFNAAVYIAGEVKDPKRTVPRALLTGTLLVTLFYLLLNVIFIYGASPQATSGQPDVAAVAAKAIGGEALANLIRVIVSIATLSSVSSMLIAGPRVYAKMADDGVFPRWFQASQRQGFEVPVKSIWLQVVLACIIVYFSNIKDQLDYLGFTLSVSAALTVACIFWTQRESETWKDRRLAISIAAVYVAVTLGLAVLSVSDRPLQLWGFTATIFSGVILYSGMKWIGRRP
ncbi:MAG: APC family permease [Planctomycetaceae bacterium]|nr:APC family permease [Planctomycetaceae bacterium]MCP4461442.1 APC family permease [Planctomycetaceae bacterium]MDG1808001.1 APC family permease [Pirellulaceae bacterium]MDG2105369.1 APC family permease [Pirellulaceae bacterium]